MPVSHTLVTALGANSKVVDIELAAGRFFRKRLSLQEPDTGEGALESHTRARSVATMKSWGIFDKIAEI